jgi:hypothetical protein
LADVGWEWAGEAIDEYKGRLLIFHHQLSLSDGASEDLSGGLFDVHNQPPWDCWIAYREEREISASGVVCWIPGTLISAAEKGIFANAEECLEWLSG